MAALFLITFALLIFTEADEVDEKLTFNIRRAFDSRANFTYTGITEIFIKPLGVSSLYFIVMGGGGGGGWSGGNASGGGGAYAFTNYNYLNPNDTLSLSINVGSGGQPPPSQAGGKTIGAQNTPDGFYESNGGNGTTINS